MIGDNRRFLAGGGESAVVAKLRIVLSSLVTRQLRSVT